MYLPPQDPTASSDHCFEFRCIIGQTLPWRHWKPRLGNALRGRRRLSPFAELHSIATSHAKMFGAKKVQGSRHTLRLAQSQDAAAQQRSTWQKKVFDQVLNRHKPCGSIKAHNNDTIVPRTATTDLIDSLLVTCASGERWFVSCL